MYLDGLAAVFIELLSEFQDAPDLIVADVQDLQLRRGCEFEAEEAGEVIVADEELFKSGWQHLVLL